MAESILGGISQEATQLELLGNITLLLAGIFEKMPRVTGNDQMTVAIESGSVGIASNQTLTTLGNITNAGGKHISTASDALSNIGALHIYNQITVS